MREEELKLEKIKKSCNITAKVAFALEIILIVATVLCVVGGSICFAFSSQIDQGFAVAMSQADKEEMVGSFASVDETSFGGLLQFTFNTDNLIENGEYGKVSGTYCFVGAAICAMVAVAFDMLRRIFKTIKTSETPFEEEVLKKLKVMFIVITVEILLMSGVGEALILGLICWSVYNIMDYGFTLQKEIDETL